MPPLAPYVRPSSRTWRCAGELGRARAFHHSLPEYAATPLRSLPELASELGVGEVLVKDESQRLGLPAFKVLGASWAVHRLLGEQSVTQLVTATDGNHGRAVAHQARRHGLAATVFVPRVMTARAEQAIRGEGAEVRRVEGEYDEAVRRAAAYADEGEGRALVQDTAWPGYEQVPAWIVEGYETLLEEVDAQLGRAPDLVAVPVGVGSLAQAVVAHYRQGERATSVLSVEPDTAACLLESLHRGAPVTVPTAGSVMAGLDCGTVSTLAWPVLRDGCDAAVAVTDDEARRAVADLRRLGVDSGPSGASALAGVRRALAGDRDALGLTPASSVVLLSTEARKD